MITWAMRFDVLSIVGDYCGVVEIEALGKTFADAVESAKRAIREDYPDAEFSPPEPIRRLSSAI